jgi:hypothetical protein
VLGTCFEVFNLYREIHITSAGVPQPFRRVAARAARDPGR